MYSSQSYRQFAESLRNYYHHHNHNHHETYHNSYNTSRYPMVNAYNGHHYSSPTPEASQLMPFPPQRYVVNTCITSEAPVVSQQNGPLGGPLVDDCQKFVAHTIQQHISAPPMPTMSPPRTETGSPTLEMQVQSEAAQNRNHHTHHWW